MRKRMLTLGVVLLVAVLVMSVGFTGCGLFEGDNNSGSNVPSEPASFVIQYTDDNGTHQITVQSGQPYSLDAIPKRIGYEFTGLYDSPTGGTQYVAANGASISPFTDNRNVVLFPQFIAKKYRFVLNYGGASVTDMREIEAYYNSELPELPINLTIENKDFQGWFTEPNCGGIQIADAYGVLPERRLVTEQNFNLLNNNSYVYLYAGFRGAPRTVTFYVGNDNIPIEMQVEHGTPISKIVPDYRDENGYAVLEWTQDSSPTENSTVFKGEITCDMALYAKTYAPIIEFDVNGGDEITPLVQPAGKNITLPTPVRTNYQFLYWADVNGEEIDYSLMPSESKRLTAVWQAMLIFDENGGSNVDDISQAVGTSVILPTPECDGYIFAGWYTEDGEKYESTRMPSNSEVLKAGWYREKSQSMVLLNSDETLRCRSTSMTIHSALTMDMSSFLSKEFDGMIEFTVQWKAKHENCSPNNRQKVNIGFYSKEIIEDDYDGLYGAATISCDSSQVYASASNTITAHLVGNKIYVGICSDMNGNLLLGTRYYGIVSDISVIVTYPDMSVMY